jgi:threonine/homoserine/homoserine lactone efflux protein
MSVAFLLKGLLIGFSIAAPVGPIGVLCIRSTLVEGFSVGLACGMGAATADAIYGCVAGFGLTFVSDLLVGQKFWVQLVGGLFLVYLGVRTFVSKPAEAAAPSSTGRGLPRSYLSTFFLTLTNPLTILAFAAIFAGMGVATSQGTYISAATLVLGVFLGSALWWVALSGTVALVRRRLSPAWLGWVNRFSGAVILAFGALALSGAAG